MCAGTCYGVCGSPEPPQNGPGSPGDGGGSDSGATGATGGNNTHEMETFFKAECITGQATNISVYKSSGFDIVIPTEGWCMGGEDDAGHATSTLFTCDGKIPSIFFK